jgi:PTH2 family peptidyl-tRNA hydrolase
LTTALITDAGKTFFKEPTKTCLAIGPDKEEKIDRITGKLKLVN